MAFSRADEPVCVLRDGMLQQVDRPQNLYNRPANLFVGGFIGSPSMNLVTARLVSDDGEAAVTFAGYRLLLSRLGRMLVMGACARGVGRMRGGERRLQRGDASAMLTFFAQ